MYIILQCVKYVDVSFLSAEEDEQEITYADVRVVQRTGRPIHQKAEMEVVYDHVKVSGRPQRTVEPVEDGCVYSEVRRGM